MMKHQTVEQLLLVFRLFREGYAAGTPLQKSYQRAVRSVAERYGVRYQTIGDGCRRRLMLDRIEELYDLLTHWVGGDSGPLVKQMKAASDPSTHDDITEFFEPSGESPAITSGGDRIPPSEIDFETITVRLEEREARMLRALAEIEGISPPRLLSDLASSGIRQKMERLAQSILRSSEAPVRKYTTCEDILRVLRANEAELRGLGIEHVSMFGSTARGDANPTSDLDLVVRLSPDFSSGGLDYFARFEALRARLAEILGLPVDLIEEPVEKVALQQQIDEDRAVAF